MPRLPSCADRPVHRWNCPGPRDPTWQGGRTYDWVDVTRPEPYGRRRGPRRAAGGCLAPRRRGGRRLAPHFPRGWGWRRLHSASWGVSARRVVTYLYEDAPRHRATAAIRSCCSPMRVGAAFYGAARGDRQPWLRRRRPPRPRGHPDHRAARRRPALVPQVGSRRRAEGVSRRPHAGTSATGVRSSTSRPPTFASSSTSWPRSMPQRRGRAAPTLAGRLDLGRIGVFGHSFEAAAAVVACQTDHRFIVGANLDGGLWREADRSPSTDPSWCCSPTTPSSSSPASRRSPRRCTRRSSGASRTRPPPRRLAATRRIGPAGRACRSRPSTARSWTGGSCRCGAGRSAGSVTPRSTAHGCGR